MPNRLSVVSERGRLIEWMDEIIGEGAMKTVYFSPDRKYVVQFLKQKPDEPSVQRLIEICVATRDSLVTNDLVGQYWEKLFCWPYDLIRFNGRVGLVAPAYDKTFFFAHGAGDEGRKLFLKGKEKNGKWFATGWHRSKLDPRELGDFRTLLSVCLLLARGVRKMHLMGLAHSDLSYRNVLIDPSTGRAAIIDVDGLVVPGRIPPQVQGTPDFIAPEVVKTAHLVGSARKEANHLTDRYALAVLIYMYLLKRHPLRGRRNFGEAEEDESRQMGELALWVEDPDDRSNRPDPNDPSEKVENKRWLDVDALPYTSLGPFLAPLVAKAFTAGLRNPASRPRADEWEDALIRSVDLLARCENTACDQKWFVLNTQDRNDGNGPLPLKVQMCPFCRTNVAREVPFLNFYAYRRVDGTDKLLLDGRKLVLFDGQELMLWHTSSNGDYAPSERLTDEMRRRVGVFQFHEGRWYLRNEKMANLKVVDGNGSRSVPPGQTLNLTNDTQIQFDSLENLGRTGKVQIAKRA